MKFKLYKLLINLLFSENKQQLIIISIDSRISELGKLVVENKYIDSMNTYHDIMDLKELRRLFSTKLFN